jgi:hypothetical protein
MTKLRTVHEYMTNISSHLPTPTFSAVTTSVGQNGYYTAGSNVQLTCTVVSGDKPTLNTANVCSWKKNGNALSSTSQFRCVVL